MRKKELTRFQVEVLNAIKRLYKRNGYMPTYKEIGEEVGICSTGVFFHCKTLAEKGWIKRDSRPRMMKLL